MFSKYNLSLLFISLLFFTSLCTLTQAATSVTRTIPILKDELGFYVEADLGTKSQPNKANLVLTFSNSDSFFPKNCFGFKEWDCSECQIDPDYRFYSIPQLPDIGEAYYFSLPAEPNTLFWNLNRRVYTDFCPSRGNINYQKKRSGLLGMGFEYNLVNFNFPKAFSVLVNKELTNGTLYYRDLPKSTRTPISTLSASKKWVVSAEGRLTNPGSELTFYGNLIFDMNSQALGFSFLMYNRTLDELKRIMDCSVIKYSILKPKCIYSGNIKDLPSLNFKMYTGTFSIPPEVYVEKLVDGVATLNIKEVSNSYEGVNYGNYEFDMSLIILDARFMSQYETVFDMSDPKAPAIKLYTPDLTDLPKDEEKKEPEQDKGNTDKEKDKEKETPPKDNPGKDKDQEKEKEKEKEIPPKDDPDQGKEKEKDKSNNDKSKDNGDRETVGGSWFSFGAFTTFVVVAVLLAGAYFAYSKYTGKKNDYQKWDLDSDSQKKRRPRRIVKEESMEKSDLML